MSAWIDETCRLRETLSTLNKKMDRLTADNKVVLSFRTEISHLGTTSSSVPGSLQEEKARAVQTESD